MYFKGILPADALAVLKPVVASWKRKDLAFPCAGNFTEVRALSGVRARLHANDVTLYSCVLGEFFAGGELIVTPREGAGLEWLGHFMGSRLDRAAAVFAFADFAEAWTRREKSPYHARIAAACKAQFPALLEKAQKTLLSATWKLASFHAGDCVAWVKDLPPEFGIVTCPPSFKFGYEKMFKDLPACFEWIEPVYLPFSKARWQEFIDLVTSRPHWIYGAMEPLDQLADRLLAKVQATNRGAAVYLYSSHVAKKRLALPAQKLEPIPFERLRDGEPVGERLDLYRLSVGEFATLRTEYLDSAIAPGDAQLRFAVICSTGKGPWKLLGALAFQRATLQMDGVDWPSIYLMSDFAVSTLGRLSKLVAAVATSRECQLLLERTFSRRFRSVVTTAFCDRPNSMKYRGVLSLLSRTEPKGEPHRYRLNYGGPLGRRDLDQILAWWRPHANPDS
jgi:hypothetical protein